MLMCYADCAAVSDMAKSHNEIEHFITGFDHNYGIDVFEVLQAVRRLRPGKSDGYVDLTSDYFLHACDESGVHVSFLFSGLLVHGCIPEDLSISTVIPVPKGKHANMTNSNNRRGIALSSMFNKLFDLILLSRYYDNLCSCDLQFGCKPKRSTDMCTVVLKESIAYYVNNGNSVYCTFLDASKAFDHVEYSKLFLPFDKTPFSALTLLVGRQEGHLAYKKNWMLVCWW